VENFRWKRNSNEFELSKKILHFFLKKKCSYDDGSGIGITHLKVVGSNDRRSHCMKIVAARFNKF